MINDLVGLAIGLGRRSLGDNGSASAPAQSAAASTPTVTAPQPTSSPSGGGGGGGPTSSPLLFFVALGFGVVFTNLWIIVGVKYCFRYNQRNRQQRNDENGEPIDLTAMPRTHRRRREKKLMTMDEVNGRFPLTKYKSWVTTRAEEGLSTAGGVASPQSRPPSMKNIHGAVSMSIENRLSADVAKPINSTSSSPPPTPDSPKTTESLSPGSTPEIKQEPELGKTGPTPEMTPATPPPPPPPPPPTAQEVHDDDDMDDDDHIQIAVPTEMLANPGDSCAICLDGLEDDDDVRGLTCGHAFHASCLDPWLINRRACCPLCKADYYVPKPRPEGEAAAELDRQASRRATSASTSARMDMPHVPAVALMASRGSAFRPRMILPGRFMTIGYDDGQQSSRYGFPTVHRTPRSETQDGISSNLSADPAPTGWRSRMRAFRFPRPNISLPNRLSRSNNTGGLTETTQSQTSTATPVTPGQLESGQR